MATNQERRKRLASAVRAVLAKTADGAAINEAALVAVARKNGYSRGHLYNEALRARRGAVQKSSAQCDSGC